MSREPHGPIRRLSIPPRAWALFWPLWDCVSSTPPSHPLPSADPGGGRRRGRVPLLVARPGAAEAVGRRSQSGASATIRRLVGAIKKVAWTSRNSTPPREGGL